MGRGEYRTKDMISSKWWDINRKVKRFNGIYSQKWQTRRSGQRDAMIEKEDDDDEIEDLTRPIGRDRAKTDRTRARRGSSSQTTPDFNQRMENLFQRIGDFNELKRERQRLVELQLLFTNTEHLTGVDREIAEREKEKIRNKYRDN
ncbi:hypothetical protein R6Q57_017229 [Mikania cordata]